MRPPEMPSESSSNQSPLFAGRAAVRRGRAALAMAAVGAVGAAAFIGCSVGPNYNGPPKMTVAGGYGEINTTQPSTRPVSTTTQPTTQESAAMPTAQGAWWSVFHDPELDGLMARAVKSNFNLAVAQARVIEARAQLSVDTANFFPEVDANGSFTRQQSSTNVNGTIVTGGGGAGTTTTGTTGTGTTGTTGSTGTGTAAGTIAHGGTRTNLYRAGFDASWEIDVFGGTRRAVEAGLYDVQAAEENRNNVLLTLLGDVATDYVDIRGFQRQIAVAYQNLDDERQSLQLTQSRAQAGIASDLDVAQAEAQVATVEATIPTLETSLRQSMHQLSILLGEDPNSLTVELNVKDEPPLPTANVAVPVGLPSELLRRRPDVRYAERQLAGQTARVGVAIADLFPRFSLTGSLGLESAQLKRLARSESAFWSYGPAVSWPIFDAGRIWANVQLARATQTEYVANYQETVLTALANVEDSLVAYQKEQNRRVILARAVASNQRAVDLSNQLYKQGLADFTTVLVAEASLYTAQNALVISETTVSTNLVSLYKALGGGWDAFTPHGDQVAAR